MDELQKLMGNIDIISQTFENFNVLGFKCLKSSEDDLPTVLSVPH